MATRRKYHLLIAAIATRGVTVRAEYPLRALITQQEGWVRYKPKMEGSVAVARKNMDAIVRLCPED